MSSSAYERISQRAVRRTEAGNWDAARRDWQEALSLAPDPAEVMLELSYVESLSGGYRLARDWALRAAQAWPTSPEGLLSLIRRLRTFNAVPALRKTAERLLQERRMPATVLAECARQLSNLNDFGPALRCAEKAVAIAPADLSVRLVRGQLLAHHRRVEEAEADIQWALQRNPRIGPAWWMLARLRRQTAQSNHVAALRAMLAVPGLRREDEAAAARALHKELDDMGVHDEAWQALERMCAAKRPTLQYNPLDSRRLVDALIAWPSTPPVLPDVSGADGKTPIFIVGMHRSGTTLLEQLLAANSKVEGLGEMVDFTSAMRLATDHHCRGVLDIGIVERAARVDFPAVGDAYLESIGWRLGDKPFFTDKQPANFLNAGFICRALPGARILHMVRDPTETCFSNLRELFSDINPYSYDQRELADYFHQYRRLMAHWHAMFPERILDVEYSSLVENPEATMRRVAAFCGMDYEDGMSSTLTGKRAVSTASAFQVSEEVSRREVPKWLPYKHHLEPMLQALKARK